MTTEHACASTDCGADAQEQQTTQYCSGISERCDGSIVPGGWTVADDCAADAVCEFDTADSWCTTCPLGCSAGACDTCSPSWTEHAVDQEFGSAMVVFAADVDGDGDPDVLGAANNADDVVCWEIDCIS